MASILQRIAQGDETAVATCLDEYGGLVWRLATRYLQQPEVEDAVQEVFLELWLKADRFDPSRGREHAFVATIARRRIIDQRRRIPMRLQSIDAHTAAENHDFAMPSREDEHDRLTAAFRQLPDDERQALWLALARGLSHREISHLTVAPIGTVKTRLRRALLRLREMIAPETLEAGGRS